MRLRRASITTNSVALLAEAAVFAYTL